MPLQASPAGLLGRFAPSGFALRAHILSRASCTLGLRAFHSHYTFSVGSLPWALCFALTFSFASLPRASRFALASSVALLPRASRFALTKIFEKNKCVSIDSKCYKTHRNAKKNTPLTGKALRA